MREAPEGVLREFDRDFTARSITDEETKRRMHRQGTRMPPSQSDAKPCRCLALRGP
jgi:hypothetical protein